MLTPQQCAQIKQSTLVNAIEVFDELPSTNDHAIARSRTGDANKPLLVVARRQAAGRGRGTNTWWATEGALTFSLLLGREPTSEGQQNSPMLSLAVGVALCDALTSIISDLRPQLKWPNDVLIDGRKIAGILIECPSSATGDLVIGIGLNMNNSLRDAPTEIAQQATSLIDLLRKPCDPDELLIKVLQQIQRQRDQLNSSPDILRQRWADLCYLTGKQIEVTLGNQRTAGLCQGISPSGALIVDTTFERREVLAGHVESIGPGSA